jgi:hypothetical protein
LIFPQVDQRNPVAQSLRKLEEVEIIIGYRDFNPAYVFALQKPVKKFESIHDVLKFTETHPDFAIITQKKHHSELDTLATIVEFEGKDLFERPTTMVLHYSHR